MTISFRCPECDRALRVPNELSGKRVRCAGCDATVVAPDAEEAPGAALTAPPGGKNRPQSGRRGPGRAVDDRDVRLPPRSVVKTSGGSAWLVLIAVLVAVGGGGALAVCGVAGVGLLFFSPGTSAPVVSAPDVSGPTPVVRPPLDKGVPPGGDRNPEPKQGPVPPDQMADARFVKPAPSAAPVSYLRVVSNPGDFIGQGKAYSYRGDELTVSVGPRAVAVGVGGWSIEFAGPGGQPLKVGGYRDAKRYPFNGESPGLNFSGNGRGCNTLAGAFVVWELEVQGDRVVKLAIDFVQLCECNGPPLTGTLRYNSSFQ